MGGGDEDYTTTFYGHWWDQGATCLPTGTLDESLLNSPSIYWMTYWYSPGLYCPSGWATAAGLDGKWEGLEVTGSTSGAICCPSSMSYYTQGHQCNQVLSKDDVITLSQTGIVITSTLSTPITIYADSVPLVWEESDLPKLASPTMTTSSISSTSRSSANESGGLTEGVKIGIGIGIPLAAILIGAGIFFLIWQRSKNKEKNHPIDGTHYKFSHPKQQIISELPSSDATRPSELSSHNDFAELPSN